MTQPPGSQDPYQHDPNAPQPERGPDYGSQGGYQPAPGYGAAPGYDGGAPAGPVAKPSSIDLAQKLTYAGGIMSLLGTLLALFTGREAVRDQVRESLEAAGQSASDSAIDQAVMIGSVTSVIFGVILAGIWFLVGFFIGKGKSWARMVATILGGLNVLLTIVGLLGTSVMPGTAGAGALTTVVNLLVVALCVAIIFFLWKKESSDYIAATR